MNAYEVYVEYIALKLHFSQAKYDYFAYGGKTNASVEAFEKRNDQNFFKSLAKHRDPKSYLLANILSKETTWVGDLVKNQAADKVYLQYTKNIESLTYTFKQNLNKLNSDFDANFVCDDGTHPIAIKLFLRKEITLETLTILTDLVGVWDYWNKALGPDIIWKEVGMKLKKYKPFLLYDREKFRQITVEYFMQEA